MIVEATIIEYLTGALGKPVYAEVPPKPPAEFVLVEKTGGARSNYIWSATLAIQSWHAQNQNGGGLYDAAVLSDQVKAAMFAAPAELSSIGGVRLNSEYNWTDPESKYYRYQAVFDVVHY